MVLPEALLDRFSIRILVDVPHPEALKALKNKGLSDLVVATVNQTPAKKISLRQSIVFERLKANDVPVEVAAKAIFGSNSDAAILASVMGAESSAGLTKKAA